MKNDRLARGGRGGIFMFAEKGVGYMNFPKENINTELRKKKGKWKEILYELFLDARCFFASLGHKDQRR